MNYSRNDLTKVFNPVRDTKTLSLKDSWFSEPQRVIESSELLPIADEWWKSTKINSLLGWENFPCVDFTLGCTHYIESTASKLKWDIQVLPFEYAIYKLMGIQESHIGSLKPDTPLFISLPNWKCSEIPEYWEDLLKECEKKNIDIHIDFAWLLVSKNIEIDVSHPCIKSFGMSWSKYDMQWNRCGIRWSRQRSLDSVTILNHYYKDTFTNVTSAAYNLIDNIERDYMWNKYAHLNQQVCHDLNLIPRNTLHTALDKENNYEIAGIGNILSKLSG